MPPTTHRQFKVIAVVPLVANLGCLLAAVLLQSRAFVLGFAISLVFIMVSFRRFTISPKNWMLLFAGLLLFILLLTFYFKTDSSLGRLLIYKCCFKMLGDHFMLGVGLGNFEKAYGAYQVAYFKSNAYTTKEFLLADNTRYAFNDYLQFIIETGIAGSIILVLVIVSLILLIKKAFARHTSYSILLLIAVSQIIAIMVAALFMHVFERMLFQTVFISSLLIVVYYSRLIKIPFWGWLSSAFLIISAVVWIHFGDYIVHYNAYKKYYTARELYGAGYLNESLTNYRQLSHDLQHDIYFNTNYVNVLMTNGAYREAIPVLEKLIEKNNSAAFYSKLADCYFETKRLTEAEHAYDTAVNMVPNRFTTRYLLFNFYNQTGQFQKAATTARFILSMPVKIPSTQIDKIKAGLHMWFKNNNIPE